MIGKAASAVDRDRIKAAVGVVALHVMLGYALFTALGIEMPDVASKELKLFEITTEPPLPPPEKPLVRRAAAPRKPKEAASPPNLKAKASEVVTVVPEVRLTVPPPIIAAPIPGTGNSPFGGAADVPGPGTGSGGEGMGTGGGGNGDDEFTPPRWLRGRIRDSDYPREAGDAGIGKTILLQFDVQTNGRVSGCTILESSGNPMLDEATCRLVERRYRFEPSRDAYGTAVPSAVVESHVWQSGEH